MALMDAERLQMTALALMKYMIFSSGKWFTASHLTFYTSDIDTSEI